MLRVLIAAVLIGSVAATATAAAGDPFSGAWTAVDQSDGSTLRLAIGGASAGGERHVTLTDGYASACGAPATAIGTGTVTGATLTASVDVRCGGQLLATDVTFAYELVGEELADGATFFVRVERDEYAGAWTAIDPSDGSTLRLQVSRASASGERHVTFIDRFASACGAAATAIGSGKVSGATLTAIVDIRCDGALLAEGASFEFELVGDALIAPGVTFVRVGA